jgi:glycosyltransferase involved in cell wall biosynthesis
MKKKVVIVSYTYPPSNAPAAQRPYALAKYLDKSKYDVIVLTCSNADSSLGFEPNFNEELPNVNLIKTKAWIGTNASSLRQKSTDDKKNSAKSKIKGMTFAILSALVIPDKAIFWFPNVKNYLKKNWSLYKDTDIVITTSPVFTNHLIGRFWKRRNKKLQWIADFRDFHAIGNELELGRIKLKIHKRLELSILKNTSTLVFVSEAMKAEYAKHYPKYFEKMKVVYNGVDLSDFENFKISSLENKTLRIFYAGSFYKGVRSPHPLFEMLDLAIKEKRILPEEVEVKIAGRIDPNLIEELERYDSFSCLKLLGLLPRKEVLEQLTTSTLLWMIVGDKLGHYSSVPLKLYEYMAARRPIINFAPEISEASSLIRDNNLGWNFDTISPDKQIQLTIFKQIIKKFKEGTLKMPLNGDVLEKFSRKEQASHFEQLFNK